MVLAFQIILAFVIVISFFGSVGERKDIKLRNNLTAICIASVFAFVIASLVL